MKKMKKLFLFFACCLLASCQSDYQEYCTQYPVTFSCDIAYAPYNAVNSLGQFITVRSKAGRGAVSVFNPSLNKTTEVSLSEVEARSFTFGLGGLILGQPFFGDGSPCYAYDLACPVCDRASARLTVGADGLARCPKCANVYDLNNSGLVTEGSGRPLYRYHVTQSTASTLYIHN